MKRIIFLLTLCFSMAWVNGQSIERQVIASAGGSFSNSSYNISWTLGEAVTGTVGNGMEILIQGFQQPDTCKGCVVGIEEELQAFPSNFIQVFPNPTEGELTVRFGEQARQLGLVYLLIDSRGRTILEHPINSFQREAKVDMSFLTSGIYQLVIQGWDSGTRYVTKIKNINP